MELKIAAINSSRDFIQDLKLSDLKNEDLIIAMTQLKMLLDDTFNILKYKKFNHIPMIIPDKD